MRAYSSITLAHEISSRMGAVLIGVIIAAALWGGELCSSSPIYIHFKQIVKFHALRRCFITQNFLRIALWSSYWYRIPKTEDYTLLTTHTGWRRIYLRHFPSDLDISHRCATLGIVSAAYWRSILRLAYVYLVTFYGDYAAIGRIVWSVPRCASDADRDADVKS